MDDDKVTCNNYLNLAERESRAESALLRVSVETNAFEHMPVPVEKQENV